MLYEEAHTCSFFSIWPLICGFLLLFQHVADPGKSVMSARFRLPAGRSYNVRATELERDRQHTQVVCNVLLLDSTVQAFKVNVSTHFNFDNLSGRLQVIPLIKDLHLPIKCLNMYKGILICWQGVSTTLMEWMVHSFVHSGAFSTWNQVFYVPHKSRFKPFLVNMSASPNCRAKSSSQSYNLFMHHTH